MDAAAERLAPLLSRLVNYERSRPDRRLWDLTTMRALLARPGAPSPVHPAVQVGGSKGKGTTCAFVAALVQAGGRSVGCYSSPHVVTLLERCRIDGRDIPVEELEARLRRLLDEAKGERAPTFFEAMTVIAAEWFAARGVDLACYEVGLGGRYDATTALPVDASVLTTIELEHTDVLGDTIAQIAAEKVPIVRPGGVGFTSLAGEALAIARAHAQAVGARLFVCGEHFGFDGGRYGDGGWQAQLWLQDGSRHRCFLPDAAAFEQGALALAAAVVHFLLPAMPLRLDPAPRPRLPCRFELRQDADGEVLVLDGAHTEASLAAVAEELRRRWPGRRAAVLFASAAGKRWREGLSALLPVADSVVVTAVTGTTGEDPNAIRDHLQRLGVRCELATDPADGLARLRARPGPRLVTGSFYLAGEVRRWLADEHAAHERRT
ncbi:MAG: hypothetical protein IT455_09750 [Planctomycetes bacterium]|nr:hypothetical protein [Planctomycetota bacterium]